MAKLCRERRLTAHHQKVMLPLKSAQFLLLGFPIDTEVMKRVQSRAARMVGGWSTRHGGAAFIHLSE